MTSVNLPARARVVIIGGGVIGCSIAYHLAHAGYTDTVLIERDKLTSGTTWHSAAQVTNFGMNQTMVGLKSHSIRLYKDLADDPDYRDIASELVAELLQDWQPDQIDALIRHRNQCKSVLKAWAGQVQPPDTYRWETRMEDNWLADK